MTAPITNQSRWQEMLRRQSLANAERWLAELENNPNPSVVAVGDYDNLLRALETTLENPDSFDLAYKLIRALYPIARDFADWERWQVYLEQALAKSMELGRAAEQAAIVGQIGDNRYDLGNLDDAERLYRESAEISKAVGDLSRHARVTAKLAVLYDSRGKTAEGIALCEQAMEIAESAGDGWVFAQANLNLSRIHMRAQSWSEGLEAAQRAHSRFQELGDQQAVNKALVNMISIWANLGEWEKVDEVSAELGERLTAAGDMRTLSKLKINLGLVALNNENFQAAETAWQEALSLHSQIQEPKELAILYNNLGYVYTKLEAWDTAEEMLNRAVEAHEKLGDTWNWAKGLRAIEDTRHGQELLTTISERLSSLETQP
jgi:tetratricopeptide (TPR) repeat protein